MTTSEIEHSLMNHPQYKENHPVLALTMGDPNGIGAEVMLKALDLSLIHI